VSVSKYHAWWCANRAAGCAAYCGRWQAKSCPLQGRDLAVLSAFNANFILELLDNFAANDKEGRVKCQIQVSQTSIIILSHQRIGGKFYMKGMLRVR
jgi:hypothetical protein